MLEEDGPRVDIPLVAVWLLARNFLLYHSVAVDGSYQSLNGTQLIKRESGHLEACKYVVIERGQTGKKLNR